MQEPLDALGTLPVVPSQLDRLAAEREAAPSTSGLGLMYVVVRAGRCLIDRDGRVVSRQPPGEAWVSALLGRAAGHTHVAAILAPDTAVPDTALPLGASWRSLRELPALSALDAELAVTAIALDSWHTLHPRCPRCGSPTEVVQAGWARRCPLDHSVHFPRTDPAVIVLVRDEQDRAVLGRRVEWPAGLFSTLAGFVEAGESAEAALLREVEEEAGLRVDPTRLRYLASQPWPFPHSLMLGYHAWMASDSPSPRADGTELAEVRAFDRDELLLGVRDGEFRVPPRLSIARRLIEEWLGESLADHDFLG